MDLNANTTLSAESHVLSKHFKATVTDVKNRRKSPCDFMKRSQKEKKIGKLKVAELVLEAAQLNGVPDRKASEEAIKAWLRRAKERHISANKKMVSSSEDETPSALFFP
ncbi:hypothetical protein JTB14_007191 [Gonioctena quinquepunctata]|nr:hypothetical protein JTB14_007191 [Gonioctena quinquepunctata]